VPEVKDTKKRAEAAKDKPAKFGPDINLEEYTLEAPEYEERKLEDIDVVDRERLLNAGVDISGRERSGSFIQVDSTVIHAAPTQEGIEVTSTRDALEKYDVLVMPTLPITATTLVSDQDDLTTSIVRALEMIVNTAPIDCTGHPATSVPAGLVNGLPTGLMIIGKHFQDATCLKVAKAIEAQAGGFPRPPAYAATANY